MARGTLAQQGAQGVGLVAALVATTALARQLELAEFGLYGLVVSFLAYISFALGSAEAAAVREISAAPVGPERNRIFTAAIVVYAGLATVAGLLLAAGGAAVVGVLGFSDELVDAGRMGAVGVGLVTAVGWPLKLFHVVLRADQRFVAASGAEAAGQILLVTTTLALLALDSPLWLLITVGSSIPLCVGLCAVPAVALGNRSVAPSPRAVRREDLRGLVSVSAGMLGVGAADVVITALDRIVLAAFRPAAVLGLYEGAIRPNNVVRSVAGAFSVTLLPVLSRLRTTQDPQLERQLVLRGTRYMLAGLVPLTAALIALAEPVLETWLGARYGEAWVACALFLAWWTVASNASIAQTTMFVDGRLRRLATLSWTTAALNLVLSLALTSWLGLEGVALGTTLAYLAVLPFWLRYVVTRFGLPLRELARVAWLPAYGTGVLVAGIALTARALLPLDDPLSVFATLAGSVALGWAFIFFFVLTPDERRLAREVTGAPAGSSPRRP